MVGNKETVVVGNIDPLDVLARSSAKEVEKEVVNLIRKMKNYNML